MSGYEGEPERAEGAQRQPETRTDAVQKESMDASKDHIERTRAQAAHQKNTKDRLPNSTTNAIGRPEITGDGGKVLVKGAEPMQKDGSIDGSREGMKGASQSGESQTRIAQGHNPLNSFFAGRMDATAEQSEKVRTAVENGELSADEGASRLKSLSHEIEHLKDLKDSSNGQISQVADASGAGTKPKEGEAPAAGQSDEKSKEGESDVATPSKELLDAYGGMRPDDLWKQMGEMAEQLDGMPPGPDKDAKARQYNDMNTVYQYLRSRE